ncbi:NitT/TauT family transport system substrate-binding protein [Nocardia transvalensis]|uniref:NitT/TauT family transport system substrate-binding protein n=1 Tax=Nocardia transvalensis TaxID=37333 RepID=A0A7W9PJG3_9NOCA|nr:ABC transporter substrate-binding protein [Nocardia transvalensis]MBB5917240.1 NitT/TauT family transport system substrate-binding protein [Nocardia transvalensis]
MAELTISATSHALNYLPQYYADHLGLFADHDVKVVATAKDPWTGVLDDLDSGAADIALGGLWVPGMYWRTPRELTVFAQVNHQFPKALVTREHSGTFEWADLSGGTVLAPGIGGSAPYAFTAGLIRAAGVDPAGITFLRDLSTPMFVELFEAGLGDAIVLDTMTAQVLQDKGTGVVALDYLDVGGLGPNSVYYCRTDRVDELFDRLVRFTTALSESMRRLRATPVADLEPLLAAHWPAAPRPTLMRACDRIKRSRTWDTARIDAAATDSWMRILQQEGMIRTVPPFADLIDTRIIDTAELAAPVR